MENENTQSSPDQTEVSGSIADPLTQERLLAVAKGKKPKGIKARHVIKTTETVKVASAFGTVNKEVEVEKVVEKTLVGEQEKVTAEAPTEDQQDAELRAKLVANGTPEAEIEAKLAEAKEVREKLKSLWSTDISKTSAQDDRYISGLPVDGNGASVNTDAGDSGVRIKFTSKPRQ